MKNNIVKVVMIYITIMLLLPFQSNVSATGSIIIEAPFSYGSAFKSQDLNNVDGTSYLNFIQWSENPTANRYTGEINFGVSAHAESCGDYSVYCDAGASSYAEYNVRTYFGSYVTLIAGQEYFFLGDIDLDGNINAVNMEGESTSDAYFEYSYSLTLRLKHRYLGSVQYFGNDVIVQNSVYNQPVPPYTGPSGEPYTYETNVMENHDGYFNYTPQYSSGGYHVYSLEIYFTLTAKITIPATSCCYDEVNLGAFFDRASGNSGMFKLNFLEYSTVGGGGGPGGPFL